MSLINVNAINSISDSDSTRISSFGQIHSHGRTEGSRPCSCPEPKNPSLVTVEDGSENCWALAVGGSAYHLHSDSPPSPSHHPITDRIYPAALRERLDHYVQSEAFQPSASTSPRAIATASKTCDVSIRALSRSGTTFGVVVRQYKPRSGHGLRFL